MAKAKTVEGRVYTILRLMGLAALVGLEVCLVFSMGHIAFWFWGR